MRGKSKDRHEPRISYCIKMTRLPRLIEFMLLDVENYYAMPDVDKVDKVVVTVGNSCSESGEEFRRSEGVIELLAWSLIGSIRSERALKLTLSVQQAKVTFRMAWRPRSLPGHMCDLRSLHFFLPAYRRLTI